MLPYCGRRTKELHSRVLSFNGHRSHLYCLPFQTGSDGDEDDGSDDESTPEKPKKKKKKDHDTKHTKGGNTAGSVSELGAFLNVYQEVR